MEHLRRGCGASAYLFNVEVSFFKGIFRNHLSFFGYEYIQAFRCSTLLLAHISPLVESQLSVVGLVLVVDAVHVCFFGVVFWKCLWDNGC